MNVEVSTISDDALIRDVFNFKYWLVEEAMDYLVGIYSLCKVGNKKFELITLDGKIYRDPEDSQIINELCNRQERIKRFWVHEKRKNDRYFPSTFIRWGLRNREVAKVEWLDDAKSKELIASNIDAFEVTQQTNVAKEMTPAEKRSLIKVIAGLSVIAYTKERVLAHGAKAEINRDLVLHGYNLAEGTFNKHMNAAIELVREVNKPILLD